MKYLLALVVAGAIVVAAVAAWPTPAPASVGPVTVQAPPTEEAGTDVTVSVHTPMAPDGSTVEVVAIGPYRTAVIAGRLEGKTATLALPPDLTASAGTVSLVAVVGDSSATTTVEIVAGPPAEPVLPLVGARSIVADGIDTAMVTTVPEDAFGNPLRDGTKVEFTIRHPGGGIDREAVAIRHTLAWAWVTAETTAGRGAVTVSTGNSRGTQEPLLEVPGPPVPFALEMSASAPLEANGTAQVEVRTDVLHDAFGNVLLDGTAVTFTIERAGVTVCLVEADVGGGRATALIPAPDHPGSVFVRAVAAGTTSAPLTIAFHPALGVEGFPASASWGDGTLRVAVGPILGPLGKLVADGTAVLVRLEADTVAEGVTVDGRAQMAIPYPRRPTSVEVAVGGVSVEVAA